MERSWIDETNSIINCIMNCLWNRAVLVSYIILKVLADERAGHLPPSIIESAPKYILYRTDRPVELLCVAAGTPKLEYEWRKDGQTLDTNIPNIKKDYETGSIVMDPATSLDEGFYQCFASNAYGRALSNVTHLSRAVLGFKTSTSVRVYRSDEGDPLTVRCHDIISVPKPVYSWAVADSPTDASAAGLDISRRMNIDDDGNLMFAYVKKSDEIEQKLYKCNVHNLYLDITAGGSYSTITVSTGTSGNKQPRQMAVTESPHVALVGKDTMLKCFFSGKYNHNQSYRPEPDISWMRQDGKPPPVGSSSAEAYNSVLSIYDVQFEDEGVYVCTGGNSAGIATANVELKVQSEPKFQSGKYPHDTIAIEKQSVTFYCVADSVPPPSVQWFINGDPISETDPGPRREISSDGQTLTVTDLCKECQDRKSDVSVIQCNSSNIHGYVFAGGYLALDDAVSGGSSILTSHLSFLSCCYAVVSIILTLTALHKLENLC